MGHGDHWKVLLGDLEKFVNNLTFILEKGHPIGVLEEQRRHNLSHPEENTYIAFEYPDTPVRCLGLWQRILEKKRLELRTSYPFLKEGVSIHLEVVEIEQGEDEFEAVLECVNQHGTRIRFFDPLFACNRKAYAKGKKFIFSLAGLAYFLEKVQDTKITITKGPSLEFEKQRQLEENPHIDVNEIKSVDFSIAELRALLPRENGMDAAFQTVIEKIEYFKLLETDICQMHVVLTRQGGEDIGGMIYASEYVLKGYKPCVGDCIRGILWLQGYPEKRIEGNDSWLDLPTEYSGLMRAMAAEEYLSDLHIGVFALADSIVASGWDVTKYENPDRSSDIPAFLAEWEGKQVNVWVRSYIKGQETESNFSAAEIERFMEESLQKGQSAAFVTVVCTDIGSGYMFQWEGLDSLEKLIGKIKKLIFRRKREPVNNNAPSP